MPNEQVTGQQILPLIMRAKGQASRCRCGKPLYYVTWEPDGMAVCLECD